MKLILDPAHEVARLLPAALIDGHDLTGMTMLDVADDFRWAGKTVDWSTLTVVDDVAGIAAGLIDRVNTEREARQMAALTPGDAKAVVYAAQRAEVTLWDTTEDHDPVRYPFAAASAARAGEDGIADAIARYRTGIAASDVEVARIEAIARAAIDAIRAASSAEAMRAIVVDWNNPPPS